MNDNERNWSKSWHFKLALLGGLNKYDFDYEEEINICDYTKRVIWGMFWFVILFCVTLFLLRIVLDTVGWIIQMIYLLEIFPPYSGFAEGGAVIIGLVVGVTACCGLGKLISNAVGRFIHKNKAKAAPSFVSSLYDSIKNKYCFYIKIK